MKRSAVLVTGVVVIAACGGMQVANARTAPVTMVTASIACGSNTSADVIITPVDANDAATGASLTVGCGQFGPLTASEAVTAGTTQWNYGGFYYPIGASQTTSLSGRVNLGKVVRASTKGARATFSLASS